MYLIINVTQTWCIYLVRHFSMVDQVGHYYDSAATDSKVREH